MAQTLKHIQHTPQVNNIFMIINTKIINTNAYCIKSKQRYCQIEMSPIQGEILYIRLWPHNTAVAIRELDRLNRTCVKGSKIAVNNIKRHQKCVKSACSICVPRGSILCSFLFSVYFNDLERD